MAWLIHLEPEVKEWLHAMRADDKGTLRAISAAIDNLTEQGPALGRPLVDKINHSALHGLKELRPGSTGTSEIRILFIFDEARQAVLLVAGDKEGNWTRWYDQAIPLAEERYKRYQAEVKAQEQAETAGQDQQAVKPKRKK
jgi:hypothetical protein